MKLLLIILFTLLLVSCEGNLRFYEQKNVGKIRNVEYLQANFSASSKAKVTCDSLCIVLWGMPIIPIGKNAEIKKDQNGRWWFVVDDFRYHVYDN